MSPRKAKTGSRSGGRARGTRGGGSAGRGSSHSRSLSATRRGAGNTRRAAGMRRGAQQSHGAAARSKRGRAAAASAPHAVKLLQQDHRAVAQALAEFESAAHEEKQEIARRICAMLTVHAQIEEELLYPAARDALDADDAHLVAEARVEHASVKDLIRQIEDREQVDEPYEARVCVLGEYVKHHVAEEEHELFPLLERTSIDLEALGGRLEERKRELMGETRSGQRPDAASAPGASPPGMAGGTASGRGHRPASEHARRR
jgi:hemerythrin-like domain-containing protein